LAVGAAGASIFPQAVLRPKPPLLIALGRAQPTNNTLPAVVQLGRFCADSAAWESGKSVIFLIKKL
jgi:hypothetical protein